MQKPSIPIGRPGWQLWAYLGLPVRVDIDVQHDDEAGVYVAQGRNIRGLVVESASLDDVLRDVELVLPDILNDNYPIKSRARMASR